MCEREPSGVPQNNELTSRDSGAAPGGPFPHGTIPSDSQETQQHRYGLRFLIAVIRGSTPQPPLRRNT